MENLDVANNDAGTTICDSRRENDSVYEVI